MCGFAYANGNGYGHGWGVGNAHINGSSVGNAYSNGDGNWSAVYADAQTSSHLAAASIDCEADFKHSRELASETREFSACRWIS